MLVLVGFAFLAGIVTILSPCILPVLPIILSGATIGDKKYPFGVIAGFIVSFSFFTLFLTAIVNLTGLSADFLRYLAMFVIFVFGLVLVVPKFQLYFEILATKISVRKKQSKVGEVKTGFGAGFFVGTSLGLVWTPCVGPILASVIALALSGSVNGSAVLITLAYALGTAIPMFAIMYGGRSVFQKVPWLLKNLGKIQRVFGVLLLIVAVAIFFNWDRRFQTYVLEKFPNYGAGLTNFETSELVQNQLQGMDMATPLVDGEYKTAPELIGTGEWFNSEPLTIESLRGKVVLVDFWTYTCINCIRTFPYIQAWHEAYAKDGLVIIAVHTPEFEFEKSASNVEEAIKDFGLTYPVVQDNDFKTWKAYENHYWPAKYLIDANGNIRYTHFGEGKYEETEAMIRDLLEESGNQVSGEGVNKAGYEIYSNTPETYLGHKRVDHFASPEGVKADQSFEYSFPDTLGENNFALAGSWKIEGEKAMASKDAALQFNFDSKKVFLVMNPVNGQKGKVEVLLDGKPIADFGGKDVKDGFVMIDTDRLYELVDLAEPGRHILELKFLDGNTELYAFTFG